jgi:RNA polymerase sigma-70 factor (ECF subfamily)
MIVIVLPDIADEDRLLAKARRGDKEALRQIYLDYFSPVYNFIRLRVDDRQQADDPTSDVFVKLMTAFRDKKAPRKSLRGWRFRVARNALYDQYGPGKKYTEEALEDWVPASREEADPELQLLQAADAQRIREAIQKLYQDGPLCQACFVQTGDRSRYIQTGDIRDRGRRLLRLDDPVLKG